MSVYALAIDIGASGGRHMLGCMEGGKLSLEEVYRFPNGMVEKNGHQCWDVNALWKHILEGMARCAALGKIPASVGVDTWGVDYVLVDARGERVGDCVAYRDDRTQATVDALDRAWLYEHTGIARQPFNTVYQLMATPREQLAQAARCLLMPDYFHFMLCGVMGNEFTAASTGALLAAGTGEWDPQVLTRAGIPASLFPEAPKAPGTRLGYLRPEVAKTVGYNCEVILPAAHDTGSAFIAVPARDDHAVTLASGTWSLLGVENDLPMTTEASRLAGFTNEGGYGAKVRFLRNIMGMWMMQNIRHELDDRYSFAEMAEMAARAAGYMSVVNVADNRFLAPQNMTAEVKTALREAGQPEPADIPQLLRCVLHSLAVGYARDIRALEKLTGKVFTAVHIVGGGSRNTVLNQWTANETGLPVYAGPTEGSALGNVIAQMIALGELENLSAARTLIRRDFAITTCPPQSKGE